MTSSPPYLLELPVRSSSPLETCLNDFPFLPGSPPPSGKGFNPFLTLELPRKGYNDHPTLSPCLSRPKGAATPHPQGSPHFSRDPISGLSCSAGFSPLSSSPPSRSPPPPSPSPQLPLNQGRCSFVPCSPLLGRPCYREPIFSGSPPPSPCFDRVNFLGSPPARPRSHNYSLISSPRIPRHCTSSSTIDQNPYLYYCYPQSLGTSPTASPLIVRRPAGSSLRKSPQLPSETGPLISPSFPHKSQGNCPIISPTLTHKLPGTGIIISPSLAHKVLETEPWSSRRSYNDPPISPSSQPTVSFYPGHLKPSDSYELKPRFDLSPERKYCSPPLSSQAGMPGCSISPRENPCHYSHLPPETHSSASGKPFNAIPMSLCSHYSPQFQAPTKPGFESLFSWETGGSSYMYVNPDNTTSDTSCAQEPPHLLCSSSPYSVFPSPPGNQSTSIPHSPPRRSYNDPPLPTPVSPKVKTPKLSELRQPCPPHKCRSLLTTIQHMTPDPPKLPVTCTSPALSHRSALSGPCTVTSISTCPNPCPKDPQERTLPTVVPRTLKTVIPTSLPFCLPCDPVIPISCVQSCPPVSPRGPPCSTHIYSVVPTTPAPFPLSGSLNQSICPLLCQNPPMVPPYGTYGIPRGPLQPCRQPMAPPCSTHIYSFIPLRAPFDLQSLPIAPRARGHPDTAPCGLHVYSVASQAPPKESPQIPYSCPLPSSPVSSSCSSNPSCSSTVLISECQSSDNQNKNAYQSENMSQSEDAHQLSRSPGQSKHPHPKSRSRSKIPHQNRSPSNSPSGSVNQGQSENPQLIGNKDQNEGTQCGKAKSVSLNKSPHLGRQYVKSNSPHHSRSRSKSLRRIKTRSKSPRKNK
ncbi:sperm head and tail associated protein-like [Erinaceus europaeus]|uniref:Sperm head and tail associated protein-like n=1 Tax=Erinaceus europaeus TaxID=9365 RepID=A0ABM3YLJ7_ERIEU|nr:sperm head and tail associated protein-like [Erinaceus europaeus]